MRRRWAVMPVMPVRRAPRPILPSPILRRTRSAVLKQSVRAELARRPRARKLLLHLFRRKQNARAGLQMALRERVPAENRECLRARVLVDERHWPAARVAFRVWVDDVLDVQAHLRRLVRVGCTEISTASSLERSNVPCLLCARSTRYRPTHTHRQISCAARSLSPSARSRVNDHSCRRSSYV